MEQRETLDVLMIGENWCAEGRSVALATVIKTWGSAPRPVGSHLVIDGDGHFEGSVSGGCVEAAVITEAATVLETGQSKTLNFGVADETAFEVGLSCGGEIQIFLERVDGMMREFLTRINSLRKARLPVLLATDLTSGSQRLIEAAKADEKAIMDRFASGRSGIEEGIFYRAYIPPSRLVIIGAVHIAQYLIAPAKACDFQLSVIDPRAAFASAERFAPLLPHAEWPDDVFQQYPLDRYSALAALTHDPKIDDMALHAALHAECFYIGALGSRKTHEKRVERLNNAGFKPSQIASLHAPIGLDIGASNPAEIAIAILAEVIAKKRGRA